MKNNRKNMFGQANAEATVMTDAKYEARQTRKFWISCIAAVIGGLVVMSENGDTSNVLELIGLYVIGGILIGGIPYGWGVVSKMTAWLQAILFLPLIGWVIYFVIKFFCAGVVGGTIFVKELFTRIMKICSIKASKV